MVSYFKTQWHRLLFALFAIVMACTKFFSTAPDLTTIEGVMKLNDLTISGVFWLITAIIWAVMSFVDHNSACINKLDERLKVIEKANNIETE